MERVFDLAEADAADHTLANNDNALVRKLLGNYFSQGAGSLDNGALVEEACGRVWDKVAGMETRPPDGWTGTVIMSLFLLAGKDCREELSVRLWRAVAHPAEKMHDGLGLSIMRRAVAAATTAAVEEDGSSETPVLKDFVVSTLRRGGHPPPAVAQQQHSSSNGQGFGGGQEEDRSGTAPSQYGLRLAFLVASDVLETSSSVQDNNGTAAAWETWRWNLHLEVLRAVCL